jgi:predicted amidohydrolase YtcJ
MGLQTVDLVGTTSWNEVLDRLKKFAAENKSGWIVGRGWDQNDWPTKEFPDNTQLNDLFAGRPVFLERVDGHAAIVSSTVIDLAGIKAGDKISGGEIETKTGSTGKVVLTGILVDNAIEKAAAKIPVPTDMQKQEALAEAERNCFAVGLTTIDDCGLMSADVELVKKLHASSKLKMKLYIMLSDAPANYKYLERKGIIKTDRLNVRSFKVYADGALGSRGACLLQPYSDKPGYSGFLLSQQAHFDSVANWISAHNFQMCTHAIGDSGNRTILDIYAKYLHGKNDRRWRIEHAQVVSPADFSKFGVNNIVPSVQPTHATSDMYWAGDRLGPDRVKSAYAYLQLLKENNWIPLGTDFPVEDISPFKTFYAAVVRKDVKGWPAGGFQTENALTREQALRGMTVWAAKSNFEENEKGSLEAGKFADFIILDKDLMRAPEKELLEIKVLQTFVNGERVFVRKE